MDNTDTSTDAISDNFSFGTSAQPAGGDVGDQADAGTSDNFTFGAPEKGTAPKDANSSAPAASDEAKSADNTDYASKGWLSDVLPTTAKLAPQQFVETVQGIGHTLNPYNISETVGKFGEIGSGLASKAEGYLGVQQDPAEKAKTESLVNAIGQHYEDTYGGLLSGDTSGLKKELMTKGPIGPLMDAATVLTGGEGMLVKAPGMLGKAGELAGKLGSAIDPVQNALRVAGTVAKPVTWPVKKIGPYFQAALSGVPKPLVDAVGKAATTNDPVLSDAFQSTFSGSQPWQTTNGIVRQALDNRAAADGNAYVASKTALGSSPPAVPLRWQNLNDAIDAQEKTTRTVTPAGNLHILNPEADAMLQQVKNEVRGTPATATSPGSVGLMGDPGFNNLQFFDDYKKQIGRMTYGKNLPGQTKGVMEQLYGGMKSAITDSYPDYQKVMENSQANINEMQDLLAQAGSDKLPDTKQFARVMLSTRKDGDTLLNALGEQDPRIPYMLAGHAMNPWLPNRLRQAIETPLVLWGALTHPAALPSLLATSPHAMGLLNYGIGKASKLPGKATLKKGLALEQGSQLQNYPQAQANGGRIERKDGGSVIDPEKEAERLIGEVGKIRKLHSTKTRPLLDVPDEAITKALAVANAHI